MSAINQMTNLKDLISGLESQPFLINRRPFQELIHLKKPFSEKSWAWWKTSHFISNLLRFPDLILTYLTTHDIIPNTRTLRRRSEWVWLVRGRRKHDLGLWREYYLENRRYADQHADQRTRRSKVRI